LNTSAPSKAINEEEEGKSVLVPLEAEKGYMELRKKKFSPQVRTGAHPVGDRRTIGVEIRDASGTDRFKTPILLMERQKLGP